MTQIHFIERDNRIHKVPGTEDIYDSGFWKVSPDKAENLVALGAHIYFHREQTAPSFFGGVIQGCRIQKDGEFEGRVVFRFQALPNGRNAFAGPDGWGNEQKTIW